MRRRFPIALFFSALLGLPALAQVQQPDDAAPQAPPGNTVSGPEAVELRPSASDSEITARLTRILASAGWLEDPEVEVKEGVVFLRGTSESAEDVEQALGVAENLEGVVAVVDRVDLVRGDGWDFSPVWSEFGNWGRATVNHLPLILLALLLTVFSWYVAKTVNRAAESLLHRRMKSELLRVVTARLAGILVFLLGLYFVLKVLGLTRLAFTVLGGTGLFGLVLGFAFRDIAENFLASVLLSVHNPFKTGDLIEVAGYKGFVQRVNSRSTVLMTLDGNHVQIPNATIYKATIQNFSANPLLRLDFTLGIGYADSVAKAQDIGLRVLHDHDAVLKDPEPLVLVESLGAATVNLHFYFWINGQRHSRFKVTSAIIRLTKRVFQDAGISMPDEAREIVFPEGVPVQMLEKAEPSAKPAAPSQTRTRPAETGEEPSTHSAEGGLESEAGEIEEQARNARLPEAGPNLLKES